MSDNGYDFYLDKCLLPVAPSKLTLNIKNGNSTVKLINEGEINILKKAELTEIEFECCIPAVKQPYARYTSASGFREAQYFLDYFELLKASMKPFQFIVCRQRPDGKKFFNTNIKVSLEEYKIIEDAQEGFDIKISVKLKQWRDYGTKTVNITIEGQKAIASEEVARESNTSPAPSDAQTYQVVKGDCLYNIAKKFYGSGSKYKVIYEANKDIIGGNPNLIYPGQQLTIPAQ